MNRYNRADAFLLIPMRFLNFLSRHVAFFSLFGLVGLLAVFLLDRGGIHLTSYFLFSAGTAFFVVLSLIATRKNGLRVPFYFLFLALFLLFVWLSWFFSPMKGEGLRELLAFTGGIFLFFSFSQISFSENILRKFFAVFLVIGGIETVYAFYVYIFGPFNRLAGTFHDYQYSYAFFPNAFANFSLAIVLTAFYFLWTARVKKHEIFSFIFLVFSLAALILSYSRGGILALVFTAIIFFGIQIMRGCFRDMGFWLLLFKAIVAVVLSFFAVWNINFFRSQNFPVTSFQKKIVMENSEKTASVDERLDFWKGSLFLIRERPLFGFGPYSFQYVFPRYQKEFLAISDHPHNVFLKIGVENGIPALASFLFFFGFFGVLFCRRIVKSGGDEQAIIVLPAFIILAFLFHNVLDYNLNFLANFAVLWAGLGLVSSFLLQHEKKMKVRRGYFFIGVGVFMFLFLFFTVHEAYYGAFYKAGRVAFSEKRYATAISAYEKAEPLWLTRRLFYDESAAYLRRYEETRNSLFLEQGIKLLFRATQENPFDAFMLNSYAETAYDHGKISMTEAISYYLKAIHLDSKNNLAYYRNLLSAYIAEGERKAFLEWEPRVSMLLERYSDQLRDNEHLTVLTDNPRYAFEIYGLLARQALSPGKRSEYLQKEADIRTFFVKKYTEMADVFDLEPLNVIF